MPYSKSKEKRLAKKVHWPDLRYGPHGEEKLFYCAEEVPSGWTNKRPIPFIDRPPVLLDRNELVAKLTELNVDVVPTWGTAHMKKVLDSVTLSPRSNEVAR
jgi:hypothetical protein